MQIKYSIIFFLSIFISFSLFPARVRVLLKEFSLKDTVTFSLGVPGGCLLVIPEKTVSKLLPKQAIKIHIKDGAIYLNNRKMKTDQLIVQPAEHHFQYDKGKFGGCLQIVKKDERIFFINIVSLEDYIFSVLKTEGWPGWPIEVNKVFAITCRTYVIYLLLEARKGTLPYDVKNTNAHQTYNGLHEVERLRQAVDETAGIFLSYEKKPILAMYDSCCGGVIPAHVKGIDFKKAPYLARSYACPFCKSCRIYSWSVEYGDADLTNRFQTYHHLKKTLKNVSVVTTDQAGLVDQVLLHDGDQSCKISGKKAYSALKEIKSFYFTISKKGAHTFLFKGKGFGHHLGLCQWGAREMVRQGWGYRNILRYYYPDTHFMVLKDKKGE